jgi:hypothetical protein
MGVDGMTYVTIGILVLVGICMLTLFVALYVAVEYDRKNPNWYKRKPVKNADEQRQT